CFEHPSIRTCFASYGQVLIIDISNLSIRTSFVICNLLFGASFYVNLLLYGQALINLSGCNFYNPKAIETSSAIS
ncbi:MAG: hypothetical protein KAV44_06310, partial [Bacteroidales bacterium]|nr:hypothetical protein [Bacteroidales bacterium]